MQLKVPDYFYDFKCIAGDCEDTCCAGWEIVIDPKMYENYKEVKGEFGKILNENIIKSDDDNIFRLKNGNCFFLNKEKTCDIYLNLGENYLCHTCNEFPRVTEEFLDKREVLLSLSCPEAARIILNEPRKNKFISREINEKALEDSNISEEVLEDYISCRDLILEILDDETIPFNERVVLFLRLVEEVQDKIDFGDFYEIKDVINSFKSESFIKELLDEIRNIEIDENESLSLVKEYFKVYYNLNHINENDPLNLEFSLDFLENNKDEWLNKKEEFKKDLGENSYIFQNLISYFVFRYFMKCIFDYDMSAKMKISIISTLIIKELSKINYLSKKEFNKEDLLFISRIYSKDIEHSDENIESLQDTFEREEIFKNETLEKLILDLF